MSRSSLGATTVPAPLSDAPPREPPRQPPSFRPDIQGLRAVAVLLVVLYHAGVPGIRGGYVGVDVFFVISGYLITGHLERELARTGRISLVGFYSRRARRLLPPAALVVVLTLVVGRFTLPYSQIASLTKDATYAAFYAINWHLGLEGVDYQNASAPPSPLQHFWSLAVEEQFYLVWPLLIIACAAVGRRRARKQLLVAAITALTAASLVSSVVTTRTDASLAYFSLQTRAWELGAGALLALTAPWVARAPVAVLRGAGWLGLTAIVVSGCLFTDQTPFPGSAALVPVLGAVAVIASGLVVNDRSVGSRLLSGGVAQHIGKTSYAWYLWHWPMLILLTAWWGRDLNLAERLEVAVLAYWFAVLTYFLENASARSLWRAGRWLATGLFLSTVMVTAATLVAQFLPNLDGTGAARRAFTLQRADLSVVEAAINRSFVIDEIPSNVRPALADASTDYPWERKQSCFLDLRATRVQRCAYGDLNGARVAVLVGDSHAEQWLDPLASEAAKSGWKIVLLSKAACPVARLEVFSPDLNRRYDECATYQAARKRAVAALGPDLVIASQADPIGIGKYSPKQWARATVEEVEALTPKRARAVYIGDSPYIGEEGLACLEANPDRVTACIYPRVARQGWTDAYRELQDAARSRGIGHVDTVEFFCNAQVCPPIVDNMITHRDNGHVTRTYATWLAPMFAPVFAPVSDSEEEK